MSEQKIVYSGQFFVCLCAPLWNSRKSRENSNKKYAIFSLVTLSQFKQQFLAEENNNGKFWKKFQKESTIELKTKAFLLK